MDDRRFDNLARALSRGSSRRSILRGLLGLGGLAAGAAVIADTDAARRGFSGPTLTPLPPLPTRTSTPTRTPTPTCAAGEVRCSGGCCAGACTATGACCPTGHTVCGPDCCPDGQAECCDNACCYGTCYGEELCCPLGSTVVDGTCATPTPAPTSTPTSTPTQTDPPTMTPQPTTPAPPTATATPSPCGGDGSVRVPAAVKDLHIVRLQTCRECGRLCVQALDCCSELCVNNRCA
jgi:hypothetical protein